jgi:hypothetical protein
MKLRIKQFRHASRRARCLGVGAVVAVVAAAPLAASALAASSGSVSETIYVGVRSLTVSPGTVSMCSTGSPLTFPNGSCQSVPITITNGAAGGQVEVNGAPAVPNDEVTNWSLCGAVGGNTCTGTPTCTPVGGLQVCAPAPPGDDQFEESTGNAGGFSGPDLSATPACDSAFDSGGGCASNPGQVGTETVNLTGPTSSTDQSPIFSTSTTWTAAPPA